jgi:hypothetical protein
MGKMRRCGGKDESIQATLVGSCLQLASKVWMCSRGFFVVQCVGEETRATKWVYCRGIGWVVLVVAAVAPSAHSACPAASQHQAGLA